jgi:hypothetical protein
MAAIDCKSVNPWMQPQEHRVDPCLNLQPKSSQNNLGVWL